MNFGMKYKAKKVYAVGEKAFTSDTGTRNGKEKAIQYAIENKIAPESVKMFDSKIEFKRYVCLHRLEEKGLISDLKVHFSFELIPAFETKTNKHNAINYECDFMYKKDNQVIVEDVKGYEVDDFKIKWAMFDACYKCKNIELSVIQLKDKGDYLKYEDWISINDVKAEKKEKKKKVRQELSAIKRHQKEIDTVRERFLKLKSVDKRTQYQEKKYQECRNFLLNSGIIVE